MTCENRGGPAAGAYEEDEESLAVRLHSRVWTRQGNMDVTRPKLHQKSGALTRLAVFARDGLILVMRCRPVGNPVYVSREATKCGHAQYETLLLPTILPTSSIPLCVDLQHIGMS